MSQTKAQLLSPVGILTASGINVSGVVTASSFVGNLTGTASTASASATAYGLTGSPNLNVGVVTASSLYGDGSNISNLNIPASFNELDVALFN